MRHGSGKLFGNCHIRPHSPGRAYSAGRIGVRALTRETESAAERVKRARFFTSARSLSRLICSSAVDGMTVAQIGNINRVSTAPRPSRSSPRPKPRSAPPPGPTRHPRAATSRPRSRTTTSPACTPRSTTRPRTQPETSGRNAYQWQCKAKGCEKPCGLHTPTVSQVTLTWPHASRSPSLNVIDRRHRSVRARGGHENPLG